MKRLWCVLSMSAIYLCSFAQVNSIQNLKGRWIGVDGGGLEVVDSSKIFLVFGKQRKPVVSFTADFSRSPASFDFVVNDSTGKILAKSLIRVDNNVLTWQVFEDGERPRDFAPAKGNIMVLRKKE